VSYALRIRSASSSLRSASFAAFSASSAWSCVSWVSSSSPRLDLLDLLLHARDALLDGHEVGVDRPKLGLGRSNVLGQVALERAQPQDLALLRGDLLLELRLAGARLRQLVRVGARRIRGSTERSEEERESEKQKEEATVGPRPLSRRVPGDGLLLLAKSHQAGDDIAGKGLRDSRLGRGAGHVDGAASPEVHSRPGVSTFPGRHRLAGIVAAQSMKRTGVRTIARWSCVRRAAAPAQPTALR
jgi:hypothetical protein